VGLIDTVAAEEVQMRWSQWVRQAHRWLSITFMVTVVIVTAAFVVQGEPALWLTLSPLLPLGLLMASGLYLFVLPHAVRWRGGRRVAGRA
jgi:cellulose synthase/poly-beta-1,6-N-acetylglucosamine synthase-like glycosyltransferase